VQFRWTGARVDVIPTKRGNLRMNAVEEMELHAAQTHPFPCLQGKGLDFCHFLQGLNCHEGLSARLLLRNAMHIAATQQNLAPRHGHHTMRGV
jgi:hypothetical protein